MSNEAWFIEKSLGIPLPCQVGHPRHKVNEPCLALNPLNFPLTPYSLAEQMSLLCGSEKLSCGDKAGRNRKFLNLNPRGPLLLLLPDYPLGRGTEVPCLLRCLGRGFTWVSRVCWDAKSLFIGPWTEGEQSGALFPAFPAFDFSRK